MELVKLNLDYRSDPNVAEPNLHFYQQKLVLRFAVERFGVVTDEDVVGEIVFNKCVMFRVGPPNDEGFNLPNGFNRSFWSRARFPDIEWDSFYRVEGSDWSSIREYGGYINEELLRSTAESSLGHYVFFMKEATFECVAEKFAEHIPEMGS